MGEQAERTERIERRASSSGRNRNASDPRPTAEATPASAEESAGAGGPAELSAPRLHRLALEAFRIGNRGRLSLCEAFRVFSESRLYLELGYPSLAAYADACFQLRRAETFEYVRVGQALVELEALRVAFAEGRLGWSVLKAVTRVATAASQTEWIEFAADHGVEMTLAEARDALRNSRDTPRNASYGLPNLDQRLVLRFARSDMAKIRTWFELVSARVADRTGANDVSPEQALLFVCECDMTGDGVGDPYVLNDSAAGVLSETTTRSKGTRAGKEDPSGRTGVAVDGTGKSVGAADPVPRPASGTVPTDPARRPASTGSIVPARDPANSTGPTAPARQPAGGTGRTDPKRKPASEGSSGGPVAANASSVEAGGSSGTIRSVPRARIVYQHCPDCRRSRMGTRDGFVEVDRDELARYEGAAERVVIDGPTPPRLRRRILAREAGSCGNPRCDRRADHCHHIVFRSRGGRTELANEVAVCRTCHALIHAGLLRVSGNADDGLSWTPILRGNALSRCVETDGRVAASLPVLHVVARAAAAEPAAVTLEESASADSRSPECDLDVEALAGGLMRLGLSAARSKSLVDHTVRSLPPEGLSEASVLRAAIASIGAS